MADELTLGRKLYAFREDRKLSQSRLEVEAELSFGTISRIENGLTNPTRETLLKISKVLELDNLEFTYLIQDRKPLPSKKEINEMIANMASVIEGSVFPCYLMDCEWRVWSWNKIVLDLYEINPKRTSDYLGMNLMRILLFSEFNIVDKIPKKHWPRIFLEQIATYRKFVYAYRNEDFTSNELRFLKKDKQFKQMWDKLSNIKDFIVTNAFYLNRHGKDLEMEIISQPVQNDFRFLVVKYYPKNYETATLFEQLRRKHGK